MAVGVEQGIYLEEIIKDNFKPVVHKAVKVFLKGESGDGWKAKEAVLDEQHFPYLSRLHCKWFGDEPMPDFLDKD